MKTKTTLIVVLFAFLSVFLSFISCENQIPEDGAMVSFAPSTTKSLNQEGQAQETNEETVESYHWEYAVVNAESIELSDNLSWTEFYDNSTDPNNEKTGLGVIKNLNKGNTYSFALRGYTTGTDGTLKNQYLLKQL